MLMLILAAMALLIAGLYLAFGPLKIDPTKLRPGQTPDEAIKKLRHMGYIIIIFCILIMLFIYFVIAPMNPY